MGIKITYNDALVLLARAVEEKGADYVYDSGEEVDCVYFKKDESEQWQPSCIVGHVLAYRGVEADTLVGLDINDDSTYSLVQKKIIDVDHKTDVLLGEAQKHQDLGIPWGVAVEKARAAADSVDTTR